MATEAPQGSCIPKVTGTGNGKSDLYVPLDSGWFPGEPFAPSVRSLLWMKHILQTENMQLQKGQSMECYNASELSLSDLGTLKLN